jgi:hypothetical protein
MAALLEQAPLTRSIAQKNGMVVHGYGQPRQRSGSLSQARRPAAQPGCPSRISNRDGTTPDLTGRLVRRIGRFKARPAPTTGSVRLTGAPAPFRLRKSNRAANSQGQQRQEYLAGR